jgi:cobalt-zinc-cadmium efflux system membrane fusion protein
VDGVQRERALVRGLPVRAPVSGVVVRFRAALGQAVKAEAPLFEVHDLSAASLKVQVPERLLARVRLGQRGRVRLTADPSFLGEAVLVRSGRVVGAGSRTVSFWADLKSPPKTPLLPEMLGRLSLVLSESAPTLAVPRGAVLREGSADYLFVRRADGVFERRPVEVGRTDDLYAEVVRGLAEGEAVAVSGVAELQTGYASLQ